MQLPYKPQNVLHRHDGTITELTKIKIQYEPPSDGYSRDAWYFIGTVKWRDGTESRVHPIDPGMLCSDTDAGQTEIGELCGLMMAYLGEHGDWSDSGRHKGWYAHRTEKRRAA